MGDIWFISFISHDGSCSLCVVLPDLSHYVFACAHIFLVCVYVIYRYIVIDRLMSLCMHGVPPLCTASACVCVYACLCLRRMDSDMCSFAGRDVSDISMSC